MNIVRQTENASPTGIGCEPGRHHALHQALFFQPVGQIDKADVIHRATKKRPGTADLDFANIGNIQVRLKSGLKPLGESIVSH